MLELYVLQTTDVTFICLMLNLYASDMLKLYITLCFSWGFFIFSF